MDERTFSYPSWLPWLRCVGLLLLAIATIVVPSILLIEPPSAPEQVAWGWIFAVFMVAATASYIPHVARYYTDPHAITVTSRGIIGRPTHGPPVVIEWDQIESVEDIPRLIKVTRIRARDRRRTIVFWEELPGYQELRRIVLEQMKAREE